MIVLACPACARQYDVSHLDAGSRVRCVCDESFTVKHTKELAVEALVCTHCGGPVGPDDEGCPYCGAALSAQDRRASMLCPGCLARIAADSRHCRACGIAIEPQALTPIPEGHACPRCEGELGIRDLGRTSVVDCQDCGGLWVTPQTFEDVCRRAGEQESVLPQGTPGRDREPPRRSMDAVRYIPCLTCGELMNRRQFRYRGAPSAVVIDACREHGVWLDHEELEQIVSFIRSGAFRGRAREDYDDLRGPVPSRKRSSAAGDLLGRHRSKTNVVAEAIEFLGRLLFH